MKLTLAFNFFLGISLSTAVDEQEAGASGSFLRSFKQEQQEAHRQLNPVLVTCGISLVPVGYQCCDADENAVGPDCCGLIPFDPTEDKCCPSDFLLTGGVDSECPATCDVNAQDGCDNGKTAVCLKHYSGDYDHYHQYCKDDEDVQGITIGGFVGDKELVACGCCTSDPAISSEIATGLADGLDDILKGTKTVNKLECPEPSSGPPDLCRGVTCTNEIEGCDPFDGQCKELDQIIPCVAVIDENDGESQASVDSKWATFRAAYPDRPFCLLQPTPAYTGIFIPTVVGPIVGTTATNDPRFTFSEVSRDQGDVNIASDWFTICGLGAYSNTQIDFVGKFLDTSGSMSLATVSASNTLFVNNVASSSLTIQEVFNGSEDYITPFLTTLVPEP